LRLTSMAETIKLPVLGPTKRGWVIAGGALIAGIVGYAWWNRARIGTPADEILPEDIPQDREPPPTVVGEQNFDTGEVRAIINTNPEWYTAAVEYLVSTGGFDFTFTTVTLGKFLARRELTEAEANLVQAAKGAVGEPPQGGPWPIIRAQPSGPTTPPTTLTAPAVRARQTSRTSVSITWGRVTGATGYQVRRVRGGTPGTGEPWISVGTRTSHTATARPLRKSEFAWGVRAVRSGEKGPEARTQTFRLG
jgi:hypothetical protein